MNEIESSKLIAVMTSALPREWSFLSPQQRRDTGAIYTRMLADLPYAAANAAVESLLATATKMPTIADVRAATLRAMHGDVRSGGDAWGDALAFSSFRNLGDTGGLDPIVFRVCERLGWISRRTLFRNGADIEQWRVSIPLENEAADRAQFIRLHDQFAQQARHEQNTAQLPAAQRFRALQGNQQAALAAPEDNTIGETNARSDQDRPARVDFNSFIPRTT